ncbi:MAG: hypothetical protein KY475_27030 [Planctomycetes bacterium]|nr:hypothetical protein [Planctomycetota bacterium]
MQPPTRNAHYQRHEFTSKEGTTLHYWLMSPAQVEADRRYPLVLALHGRGGNTQAATVLGSSPKYTKYAGVGHTSWGRAYGSAETWEWLFAQKRAK